MSQFIQRYVFFNLCFVYSFSIQHNLDSSTEMLFKFFSRESRSSPPSSMASIGPKSPHLNTTQRETSSTSSWKEKTASPNSGTFIPNHSSKEVLFQARTILVYKYTLFALCNELRNHFFDTT